VLEAYPKQVKLVFKQYPLSSHQHARGAALASLAAAKQGKFWEMHDRLFENYNRLGDEKGVPRFSDFAKGLGLNVKQFEAAMKDPALEAAVVKDLKDGSDARVTGTPSLYVNGRPVPGQRRNFEGIKEMIEAELAKAKPATGSK
jgi:protein-disulfide isomerase